MLEVLKAYISGMPSEDEAKKSNPSSRVYGLTVSNLQAEDGEDYTFTVFFTKPRRPDWGRLVQEINKKSEPAMQNFLIASVLPLSKDAMLDAFEEWPGLRSALCTELMEMLGANALIQVKPL